MRLIKHWVCVILIVCGIDGGRAIGDEVRDLLLVAGQSNAVGYDAYSSELPASEVDRNVMFWFRVGDPPPDKHDSTSSRMWTHLQVQPQGTPLSRTADEPGEKQFKLTRQYGNFKKSEGGFGPEMGMVRELFKQESKPLAVIKVAFSGTGMATDWDPNQPGPEGACYRMLVEETKAAIAAAKEKGVTFRLRAFVWVQGETDSNATDAPLYDQRLGRMLEQLREELDAPNLLALISINPRFGNGKNPNVATVIERQRALAKKDPRCVYVDCEGAETLGPSHTHFTAAGTLEIGKRFANQLLHLEADRASTKR